MNAARPVMTPLYPAPEGLARPLRVVLVTPAQTPGWVSAFRELAMGCDWIELMTLATRDAVLPCVADVPADLRAFVAFESAVLEANRSLAPTSMAGDAQAMQPAALEAQVRALQPDLLILFGPVDWAATVVGDVPYGCWHVDASLVDPRHAGLSLLAPMVHGEIATQMGLVLHDPAQGAIDLASSWGRTRATSFLLQREDAFRKLPSLLLRGLHRLAAGQVSPTSYAMASLQLRPQRPLGRAAGVRGLLSTLRAAPRWLMGWRRNGRVGWTLVLRLGGTPLDPEAPSIGSHALLKAPKGWWGDPFAVTAHGRRLIYVEEMPDPRQKKANIACVELVSGGARRLGVALEEPGHLSFPQVFEWEGQWYMTVESGNDRRVSLYQAANFPLEWTRVRDLITGRVCVDPVLHHHEGRWYLFANVAENRTNTCDELFLFVADDLLGPFVPHPASPIVCDVRHARMAGRLFHHRGRLIRAAQDCGPGYGNAVVFHHVVELGPTVYRERALARLAPHLNRTVDGCHTYNIDGGIEVLDVLGRPPNSAAYLQLLDEGAAGKSSGSMPVQGSFGTGGAVHTGPPPR